MSKLFFKVSVHARSLGADGRWHRHDPAYVTPSEAQKYLEYLESLVPTPTISLRFREESLWEPLDRDGLARLVAQERGEGGVS